MKESRVLLGFLILLSAIALTACGKVPEPGGVPPVVERATPAPAATPVPEQPGMTVFRGSGILTVIVAVFDPANPEIIYVGAYNGLFRSTDGGGSWHLLSADLRYSRQILIDPTNPQVLYARRFGTQDGEDTGRELPGIYKSTNGGITWQVKEEGTGGMRIYSIALDPSAPQVLYAGSIDGIIFRSTDAGETWGEISGNRPTPPGRSPINVRNLVVHPRTGEIYALGGNVGTFKSSDGGQTWTFLHADTGYLAIDTATDTLYLAGRDLWRSTDGGASWQDITGELPYVHEQASHVLTWVGVNPDPPALYVVHAFAHVYRSTDGGMTWLRLDTGGPFRVAGMQVGAPPTFYGNVEEESTLGRYIDSDIP